jgi:hypothetical protein
MRQDGPGRLGVLLRHDPADFGVPSRGIADALDYAAFGLTAADLEDARLTLWVPIIHPCWSGSMPVLVEGATDPVPSADIQLRDLLRIGNRFG